MATSRNPNQSSNRNHQSGSNQQRNHQHSSSHSQHRGGYDYRIAQWNSNLSAVIDLAETELQNLGECAWHFLLFLPLQIPQNTLTTISHTWSGPAVRNEDKSITDYRRELVLNLTVLRQWRQVDYENGILGDVLGGGDRNQGNRNQDGWSCYRMWNGGTDHSWKRVRGRWWYWCTTNYWLKLVAFLLLLSVHSITATTWWYY